MELTVGSYNNKYNNDLIIKSFTIYIACTEKSANSFYKYAQALFYYYNCSKW